MIKKKFNWKIYFLIILFGCILLLAAYAVFILATGQVVDDNNLPLTGAVVVFMCLIIIAVCSTYAVTVVVLLRQIIKFKNTAFEVDKYGIHNTFIMMNVFAFVLAVPIKHISWKAVSNVESDDVGVYIRVNTRGLEVSFIAKFVFKITGYRFCNTFITPKLSCEEIKIICDYCYAYSPYIINEKYK